MADRRVSVTLDAKVSPFVRGTKTAAAATRDWVRELESADSRMANLVQTGMALAPALTPIGATAVPALASLTMQLGLAAAATGVAVAAFNGVGDALDALNDYQLDPTIANAEKLSQAMAQLPESGRVFVRYVDSELMPALDRLQDVAADELLPDVQTGLDDFMTRLPQFRDLVAEIADVSGDLFADVGTDVASGEWDEFLAFLEREARPTLSATAETASNMAETVANALMGLDPATDMVTEGLVDLSQRLADIDPSDYQGFTDYVTDVGPQVWETLESIAGALAAVVQAAAPVGEVALPVIEALADTLSIVASSPAGPALIGAAAGVGLLGRSLALLQTVGLRGGQGGVVATALGVDKLKSVPETFRKVASATDELRAAQSSLTAQSLRTRDAQFALIPTADKRAAVRDYAAAQRSVSAATERVAVAERERSAAMRAGIGQLGRTAGLVGGLALTTSGYAEQSGLANTATMALMGTIAGPWGAAIGAGTGLVMDFAAANNDAAAAVEAATRAVEAGSRDQLRAARQTLRQIREDQEAALEFDWSLNPVQHVTEGWAWAQTKLHELSGTAPDVTGALSEVNGVLRAGGDLADIFGRTIGRTGDEMRAAAGDAEVLSGALADLAGWLDKREALRGYSDSVAALSKSLKGGFSREMVENLDAVGRSIIQVAENMRPKARANFVDNAVASLEKLSEGAGPKAAGEIDKLIHRLDVLGETEAEPKVDVDNKPAIKGIDDARRAANDFGTGRWTGTLDANKRPADSAFADLFGKGVDFDRSRWTSELDANGGGAISVIDMVRGRLTALDGDVATVYVRTVAQRISAGLDAVTSAEGNYFPGDRANAHQPTMGAPGVIRIWNEPEAGGETYIPHADDYRRPRAKSLLEMTAEKFGGQVTWFAEGGFGRPVAGSGSYGSDVLTNDPVRYDLDDRLGILQLRQQVNQLRRELAKDGKGQLKGLARAIAEAELEAAKRDLRSARRAPVREMRDTVRGLRAVELDVEAGASVEDTRQAIQDFRRDLRDAGGEWTKSMRNQSRRLVEMAERTEATNARIEREEARRDQLTDKLDEQARVVEDLNRTMDAFGQQVAGNFLSNPFQSWSGGGLGSAIGAIGGDGASLESGLAGQLDILRQRQRVEGLREQLNPAGDPDLVANKQALAVAERRLMEARAIRDPLEASYQASKLLPEVLALRDAVAAGEAQAGPTGLDRDILELELELAREQLDVMLNPPAPPEVLSRVEQLRATLEADAAAAQAFNEALRSLTDQGVNAELFQQLATSGDLELAQELASASGDTLAEINDLWDERSATTAQLQASATQEAFGAQHAAELAQLQALEAKVATTSARIDHLNAQNAERAARMELVVAGVGAAVTGQVNELKATVNSIPRQQQDQRRGGRGRS